MKKIVVLFLSLVIGISFLSTSHGEGTNEQIGKTVHLTDEERAYIASKGTIQMVVDPDWYPYEELDENKMHRGIAAELIQLIESRTGLSFEVVPTANWEETLEVAKAGKVDVVSFLNASEERSKWLIFSKPYFVDPNVLITRENHDYISNLARLSNETLVLPKGTSIEERLRKDYPNINIVTVASEADAIEAVDQKKADMTLRSLTMAAFIIKEDGFFNLKIAGEIPAYTNQLRMGITGNDVILQGIIDKGIDSISQQEVQQAINQHVSIKIVKGFDYKLFGIIFGLFSLMLITSLYWMTHVQKLNQQLKQAALVDALSGLLNRHAFNQRVEEEIERARRYNTPLSLLMIDLDHFKRINDTYGHVAGDEVIRNVSRNLKESVRKIDIVARWGGEEFVVMLPGIALEQANVVANKLIESAANIHHFDKEKVTISIGVSTWDPEDSVESWLGRTDTALYHAKEEGRNRACLSEGTVAFLNTILNWDNAWNSGNESIDLQHQALLAECNELIAISIQANLKESVLPKLGVVLTHIQRHFAYEEELLETLSYDELEAHKRSHRSLLDKADQLLQKSVQGNLLPSDVIRFIIGDVVTLHLVQEDTKFFETFGRPTVDDDSK